MNGLPETQGQCPAAEILAAYLESQLTTKERILIEDHLVTCNKCRHIVSTTVKSQDSIVLPSDVGKP
jgi:predicted anti-sigma-YlaC factor YlaD